MALLTVSSGTPFTVYDTRNVAQQGSHPEIYGLRRQPAGRDRRPESRAAYGRAVGLAHRVPAAGRHHRGGPFRQRRTQHRARSGPGHARFVGFQELATCPRIVRLQLRIEAFNVLNHANFGVPVNDLVSPNFGRILEAGPPRVFQAGLKILF